MAPEPWGRIVSSIRSAALVAITSLCLAACDPRAETDYVVVRSLPDQATGACVELGLLINISSYCYVVNVFSDAKEDRPATDVPQPALMVACGVGDEEPHLRLEEDGCYVFSADYGFGGLRRDQWIDEETGKSICFEMVPPRPKGGWGG